MYYQYCLLLVLCAGYTPIQAGNVTTYIQLLTYKNPGWLLGYTGLSCSSNWNSKQIPDCKFQFTTSLIFANKPPSVVSSHLIPATTDDPIQFTNTSSADGTCNQLRLQQYNVPLTCNDTTWANVSVLTSDEKPLAIQITVLNYGTVSSYKSTTIPNGLLPNNIWYVDTFYQNVFRSTPAASNVTMQSNQITLQGSANNGQSSLTLTLSFQCAAGYWGPQCNFTKCTQQDNKQWLCQTEGAGNSNFLCTGTDTTNGQPTDCAFCPGGYAQNATCLTLPNNQPTNLNQVNTGYVAGIVVLAVLAAIELIIIIAGACYYYNQKKKAKNNTPPPPATLMSGRNKTVPKSTTPYQAAPMAEAEEWSTNGNRRNYNEPIASDEYSIPTPNGSRREAAV